MTSPDMRHGAYLCLRAPAASRRAAARLPIPELVARLGLENEYHASGGHPQHAVAFLRRAGAAPGDLGDDGVAAADAVVHVASPDGGRVDALCAALRDALGAHGAPRELRGVAGGLRYTGPLMHDFAYARQRVQTEGALMPNAFLLPLQKTAGWWAKDWMERHTYFLPRHDDDGRRTHEGHALAAAAGVSCLMRRTYRAPAEPAADGGYDFLTYFECADADVVTFHAVCAALRDVRRNPEWRFVREGPLWQGRRVAAWGDLFA
jgi:hypothetical protein